MTGPYLPTCPACRDASPNSFYVSCQGCQARKARIEATRLPPPITASQVVGMDSTMQPLEPK